MCFEVSFVVVFLVCFEVSHDLCTLTFASMEEDWPWYEFSILVPTNSTR